MTAPATTARLAPAGIRLDDGFSTVIAFERDPNVSFWEKTVQPPGLDGGDPIETTTMHNTLYRTMAARALITLTESTIVCAFDPNVYNNIIDNLINREGAITLHFSDGSTLDFFGYLQTFEAQDAEEGAQPEANITIVPTNTDPVTGGEESPVITEVAGT